MCFQFIFSSLFTGLGLIDQKRHFENGVDKKIFLLYTSESKYSYVRYEPLVAVGNKRPKAFGHDGWNKLATCIESATPITKTCNFYIVKYVVL